MTKEIYDNRIKSLKDKYEADKKQLMLEFVMQNKKYNIGDVVEEYNFRIKIKEIKIKVPFGSNYPEAVYYGPLLKKDGAPYKNGKHEYVYESNVKGEKYVSSIV